jgi:hypothetical protein
MGSGDFELPFVILCVSMVYLSSLKHEEILIMLPQQGLLFGFRIKGNMRFMFRYLLQKNILDR